LFPCPRIAGLDYESIALKPRDQIVRGEQIELLRVPVASEAFGEETVEAGVHLSACRHRSTWQRCVFSDHLDRLGIALGDVVPELFDAIRDLANLPALAWRLHETIAVDGDDGDRGGAAAAGIIEHLLQELDNGVVGVAQKRD
jgi:hypothetical protein